ncbi:MAG: altronate dehydratase family protein [Roseiarcus sp.]|jgi:altronate hydrolase
MTTPRALRLSAEDNVMIAVDEIRAGDAPASCPTAAERIPRGHKIATAPIAAGAPIRKFGQIIGFAAKAIEIGQWVHEHNCVVHDFSRDYCFCEDARPQAILPVAQRATFQGYRRAGGKAGTRNYLGVFTSVNCSATVARLIAREVERSSLLADYPHVDGVVALIHGAGCGMAPKGEGFDVLSRAQWGYATHPNMGGVLMVGLGCEVFQIGRMKDDHGLEESDLFHSLTIQASGGTRKTVEAGLDRIKAMLPIIDAARRETLPASELTLALQCGGSDAYSGITANPALGAAADILVSHGGTAILSETPEIYGAEHLLTRRAATPEIGRKLIDLIHWWEDYCARNGGEMNNNPSPGNKAGGLTTILEKSLGAAAKGGTTIVNGVYRYAEPVAAKGLVFMDTPGYDPVSATGQVAGGANVIAFTTGRGSAYGCKPTPSIKLASNNDVYQRMAEDMDINCGDVLDGVSIAEKGQEIFDKVLAVASGEKSKSEALGYGEAEFAPWRIGATM